MALECLRLLYQYFNVNFSFFHYLAILLFSDVVIFMTGLIGNKTSCRPTRSVIVLVINKSRSFDFVITRMITDQIGLRSVQLPFLITLR